MANETFKNENGIWFIILAIIISVGILIILFSPRPRMANVACSSAGMTSEFVKTCRKFPVWEPAPLIRRFIIWREQARPRCPKDGCPVDVIIRP